MHLTTGTLYQATIRLGFFESVASNDSIAAKLLDAGFVNVTVWGSGRDRFARGEWGGATQDAALPEQIKKVEIIT
jgi:hypothetical protein